MKRSGPEHGSTRRIYVRLASIGLAGLGLAAVILFFVMQRSQIWTGGSTAIALMIVLGAVLTAILTGVLMALAFYSSRRGYDEPPRYEERGD